MKISNFAFFTLFLMMPVMAQNTVEIENKQYKRVHIAALKAVDDGNAAGAVEALRAHIAEHGDDKESQYALAAALAQVGDLDAAYAAAERALALGLAPGRFVAGPRGWFAPLQEHDGYRELMALVALPIAHGPLVGSTNGDDASIWVRGAQESDYAVQYRRADATDWQTSATTPLKAENDFTGVVRIDGLSPNTAYEYRVMLDGEPADKTRTYRFSTLSKEGEAGTFRIVFGGGSGYVPEHEYAWYTIANEEPDALVFLGDNVYIDHQEYPNIQRYCYYRRQSRPEWRALTSRVPVFAVWDDHDFADNDSMGGPEPDVPGWKPKVWEVFKQNWANASYGGGADVRGCWFQFSLGDVDFFMLDSRYYRTRTDIANPSMLGLEQKKWLLEGLAASDATFKMICSPVPVVEGTKGDSDDTWDGFAEERKEIFDFIRDTQVEGVVVLSADRHRSDVWRIDHEGLYPVYEFESSRLTNQHVHEEKEEALFSYNDKQSFGMIDYDTTAGDPELTYTIVSIDGEHVHKHRVKRSELAF